MAEHHLDHPDIDPGIEQVGGEGMPKHVRVDRLAEPGSDGGGLTGARELAGADVIERAHPAGEQVDAGPRRLPPGAQLFEQQRRELGEAIAPALAVLDAQHHALAVDIRHLDADDLRDPEARAIGKAQGCPILGVLRCLDQARDLVRPQHLAQPLGLPRLRDHLRRIALAQGDTEEEPQRGDLPVDRVGGQARLDQMQLPGAHVLVAEPVRRASKMPAEPGNGAQVGGLRSGRQAPDRHVLDHALAQRADRLSKAAGGNGVGIVGHGLSPRAPWTIHALEEKGAADKTSGLAA